VQNRDVVMLKRWRLSNKVDLAIRRNKQK
jgi:hypothetical protein